MTADHLCAMLRRLAPECPIPHQRAEATSEPPLRYDTTKSSELGITTRWPGLPSPPPLPVRGMCGVRHHEELRAGHHHQVARPAYSPPPPGAWDV